MSPRIVIGVLLILQWPMMYLLMAKYDLYFFWHFYTHYQGYNFLMDAVNFSLTVYGLRLLLPELKLPWLLAAVTAFTFYQTFLIGFATIRHMSDVTLAKGTHLALVDYHDAHKPSHRYAQLELYRGQYHVFLKKKIIKLYPSIISGWLKLSDNVVHVCITSPGKPQLHEHIPVSELIGQKFIPTSLSQKLNRFIVD